MRAFLRGVFVLLLAATPISGAEPAKPLHTLRPPGSVKWLAFAPDCKTLASGNENAKGVSEADYELRLWNLETGKLAAGPIQGVGIGASAAISADGKLLLTGGSSSTWRLWQLPGLVAFHKGKTGTGRVEHVGFDPKGKTLVALDVDSGKGGTRLYTAFAFDAITYRPVGQPLAWPTLQTKDWKPGQPQTGRPADWTETRLPKLDANGMPVRPKKEWQMALEVPGDGENCGGPMAAAIGGNGKIAASAGCNGEVVVWDYAERKVLGKPLVKYENLQVHESGLAVSSAGRFVSVARMQEDSNKGHLLSLTVFEWPSRKIVLGPLDLGVLGVGLVNALQFSPDESKLAVAFNRRGYQIETPSQEIQIWAIPVKK